MARKLEEFAKATVEPVSRQEYVRHGAARAMFDSLEELAAHADGRAGGILELDPLLIDPSPFRDRLPDDNDAAFEEFKKSLAENGQKVPVQVRHHPTVTGRYQTIYGHRRVRAARELGLAVKAISVEISDTDLVVAQGIENAARQDLSWIEKALFAKTMDDAGVKARDIYSALSINDTALWQMRTVYQVIPLDIVEAIGRAPKIGRPRWTELAKAVERNGNLVDRLRKNLTAVRSTDSNERFQSAVNATRDLQSFESEKLDFKIVAKSPRSKAFAKFVESRLPALMKEFELGEN